MATQKANERKLTEGHDSWLSTDWTTGLDTLLGEGGNDTLYGDERANTLKGGDGDDVLRGLGGNDKLYGGADNDVLIGGAGSDTLYGGHGNDVLYDDDRGELRGEAGNDVLIGRGRMWGGPDADTLIGVGSYAILRYNGAGVTVNLQDGTSLGGEAEGDVFSNIYGIVGTKANDVLIGEDNKKNYFRPRQGTDTIDGGKGGDENLLLYTASEQGVMVDLEALTDFDPSDDGEDLWAVGGTVGWTKEGDPESRAHGDKLRNITEVAGSPKGDILKGDGVRNGLMGQGGDDVLWGRGGNDWLHAHGGDDELNGGAGADGLHGGEGNDTASYADSPGPVAVDLRLVGWANPQRTTNADGTSNHEAAGDTLESIENLTGSTHADTLRGNAVANVLKGGDGSDSLNGGAGNDTLEGGAGNDLLEGGAGEDTLRGGSGTYDIATYSGSPGGVTVDLRLTGRQLTRNADGTSNHDAAGDTLEEDIEGLDGSIHADKLIGNGDTNYLFGHEGDDTLMGEGGDDEIKGWAGKDTLYGGTGADTFVFDQKNHSTVAAADVVKDFSGLGADGVKQVSEDGDKLDLSGLTETQSYSELKFLGTGNFSGTGLLADGTTSNPAFKGEVRYSYRGDTTDADTTNDTLHTDVTVDLDGDGAADFQVTLEGAHYTLTGADLILA